MPRKLLPLLVVTGMFTATALDAVGQIQAGFNSGPKDAKGKIIGRIWHSKVNAGQFMQYTQKLSQELELPQSPIMIMMGGAGRGMFGGGKPQTDIRGTLIFLETSPKPGTPRMIGFQKMENLEAFQKFVKTSASRMGPMGELVGSDDRFEVKLNLGHFVMPAMNDAKKDAGDQKEVFELRVEVSSNTSIGRKSDLQPPNGKPPRSISTFYRYHDGIMYSGQMAALHTMSLPVSDSMMMDAKHASQDIHGVLDLSQVPKAMKEKLWLTTQVQTMTLMQRYDTEAAGEHSLRHAIGQSKLEFMKAAVFDIDQVEFSVKLADTDTPLTASAKITAREESRLASSLSQMNRTPSRLGVLRTDESPMVLSTTFDLPDVLLPLATELVESALAKAQESADNQRIEGLLANLFGPIQEAAKEGQLDAAMRIEGNPDDGMVLAGGLRLPNAEEFHANLETLLLLSSADGNAVISRSPVGDQQAISIRVEEWNPPFGKSSIPVQAHVAASGSYLWFAIGGDGALDSLESHVNNQDAVQTGQTRPMPLHLRMRLSDWKNSKAKGTSQVPYLLINRLEQAMSDMFAPMFNMSISFGRNGNKPEAVEPKKADFTSFADKLLDGRSGDLEIESVASGRTLEINASVGEGVAKFLLAQYTAAQNRMFSGIKMDLPVIDIKQLESGKGKGTSIRSLQIRGN